MRIAIAEDVALIREGISAVLERNGHTVVWTVADAAELRHRFAPGERSPLPDLLIADVRMPPDNTDDGLRAAIDIRHAHPNLSILILSQHLGNNYARELLSAAPDAGGGTGYLLKERVGRLTDFLDAITTVGQGGITIDPKVVAHLLRAPAGPSPLSSLSDREREVLTLMAEGRTNDQVGATLHLSAATVEKHIGAIFTKLGLHSGGGNKRVLAVLAHLKG